MRVSPAKHSFGKFDIRTDRQTDRRTDDGQSDPYVSLCFTGDTKIVAAFRGMHVLPAKHSFGKCDRRTDGQTDRQTDGWTDGWTDDEQSDPYVSLCFAGDTKTVSVTFNHTY